MPASVLLDTATLARTVQRLGAEIEADHPDGVLLIGVLKGALIFVADLSRQILGVPVEFDFMSISRFAPDSGRVKILQDLSTDIGGRDVVIVEDIVDTGLTLAYLTAQLENAGTADGLVVRAAWIGPGAASSPRRCAIAVSSSATSSSSATDCT